MREVNVTVHCDVCGAKMAGSRKPVTMPALVDDMAPGRANPCVENFSMDLCDGCLERVVKFRAIPYRRVRGTYDLSLEGQYVMRGHAHGGCI